MMAKEQSNLSSYLKTISITLESLFFCEPKPQITTCDLVTDTRRVKVRRYCQQRQLTHGIRHTDTIVALRIFSFSVYFLYLMWLMVYSIIPTLMEHMISAYQCLRISRKRYSCLYIQYQFCIVHYKANQIVHTDRSTNGNNPSNMFISYEISEYI